MPSGEKNTATACVADERITTRYHPPALNTGRMFEGMSEAKRKIAIEMTEAQWGGMLVVLRDAARRYTVTRSRDQIGLNICCSLAVEILNKVVVPMNNEEHSQLFTEYVDEILSTDPKYRAFKRRRIEGN